MSSKDKDEVNKQVFGFQQVLSFHHFLYRLMYYEKEEMQ